MRRLCQYGLLPLEEAEAFVEELRKSKGTMKCAAELMHAGQRWSTLQVLEAMPAHFDWLVSPLHQAAQGALLALERLRFECDGIYAGRRSRAGPAMALREHPPSPKQLASPGTQRQPEGMRRRSGQQNEKQVCVASCAACTLWRRGPGK